MAYNLFFIFINNRIINIVNRVYNNKESYGRDTYEEKNNLFTYNYSLSFYNI